MTDYTPDAMPILSHGDHPDPKYGACFMEYTALLAGQPFSDHPPCVDPYLTQFMIGLNDSLSDKARQVLVPFLGRGIGLVAPGRPVKELFYIDAYRQAGLDLPKPSPTCKACDMRLNWVCDDCIEDTAPHGVQCEADRAIVEAALSYGEKENALHREVYRHLRELSDVHFPEGLSPTSAMNYTLSVLFGDYGQDCIGGDEAEARVVKCAEDAHTAFERAMDDLGWEIKREVACKWDDVTPLVGAIITK